MNQLENTKKYLDVKKVAFLVQIVRKSLPPTDLYKIIWGYVVGNKAANRKRGGGGWKGKGTPACWVQQWVWSPVSLQEQEGGAPGSEAKGLLLLEWE